MNFKIDNLQYCNWSRNIFEKNREAGLDAIHVTIVYHEDFDELKSVIKEWEKYFSNYVLSRASERFFPRTRTGPHIGLDQLYQLHI